jgi:hypothetical protein
MEYDDYSASSVVIRGSWFACCTSLCLGIDDLIVRIPRPLSYAKRQGARGNDRSFSALMSPEHLSPSIETAPLNSLLVDYY